MLLRPAWALAPAALDPRVAGIVRDTLGIDTHNHVDVPLEKSALPGPDVKLADALGQSGLSAICMTFAVDYQSLANPDDGYARFITGLDAMDAQLARDRMHRALTLPDLLAAHAAGQPTVVQSVEGSHFLQGRMQRIGQAYGRGLRHLGLLHDHDAVPPLGDVYTNPEVFGGLTELGKEVVRECERLGILLDLTHGSEKSVRDALRIAHRPLMISHTGLDTQLGDDPEMARIMRPRLTSAALARDVAAAGGVVGVWTHLAATPLAYAQNIRAMVDVAGIDHVCIGTDTKLTRPSPRPAGSHGGTRDRYRGEGHPPGNHRPGSHAGGVRTGERTNLAWAGETAGFYPTVVDALLKTGFSAEEIGKIGGGNFCRIFGIATSRA